MRAGLSSIVDRSLGFLQSVTGVQPQKDTVPETLLESGVEEWGKFVGLGGGLRADEMMSFRRILFWIAVGMVLLLLTAITNPTESSFRSHLTELSFRKHLSDLRVDDQHTVEDETPQHDKGDIAPFRFANHVAISLRTPTFTYLTYFFLSLAFTSPPQPPAFLSDPQSSKHKRPRETRVAFWGFLGFWIQLGIIPAWVDWIARAFKERSPKGKKKGPLPGVIELRAVQEKPSTISLGQSLAASKLFLRSESFSSIADAAAPSDVESRRPSIVSLISPPTPPEADISSPILNTLKSDLATAQSALSEVQGQAISHEESVSDAHASLHMGLEDIRSRKKEDDIERQELKTKTKNLEEQKRQAESHRRESEKKLKAAEGMQDSLEARILGAVNDAKDFRAGMENSGKGVTVIEEEGSRHCVETREEVLRRKEELAGLEVEIGELEARNEELGIAVREAEQVVKSVIEVGGKISPEEEMMMMAAAYEAAANEGYYQQSNGWANQAAAYMSEAGMPYLDQTYSRPYSARNSIVQTDLSGFENFGPAAKVDTLENPGTESDPGSPNGLISSSFDLLPQGLFRSLEGESTPIDEDLPLPSTFAEPELPSEHHESGSEEGSDEWRSPTTRQALFAPALLPPTTSLPSSTSRRWFSGASSTDNVNHFNFHHPTTSNDSLNLGPGYDSSPFAPSDSEKKALRWGPLSKYRWAGANRPSDEGQESNGLYARSSSVDLSWRGNPQSEQETKKEDEKAEKTPFRFFSLRKPSGQVARADG